VTDDEVLTLCRRATRAVAVSLASLPDWGLIQGSAHQHHSDLAADAVAVEILTSGGLGVLSEESGVTRLDRPLLAVLDPLDGSSNAAQGLPWFACSLCVLDEAGPWVALVTNLATGVEYRAVRGAGAWKGESRLANSGCTSLSEAIVGLSGLPPRHLGWRQFRALGAAALDLCAVAEGVLDAWVDCSVDAHGVWDYLAGQLICLEAGASVAEVHGRDLVVLDHAARRTPLAAASAELATGLLRAMTDMAGEPAR
jgi:fructose-1,6-bisphosphatase/inositol monophosphatase family enzyme